MKIRLFHLVFAAAVVLASLSSCTDRKAQNSSSLAGTAPAVFQMEEDSVVFASGNFSYCLSVEFPSDSTSLLSRAVGEYLNEALGGSYEGSAVDFRGILGYYANEEKTRIEALVKDFGGEETEWFCKTYFRKYCESDKYLSLVFSSYSYTGGAHGSSAFGGATFRKSDGRKIGWDVFSGAASGELNDIIKRGLSEFWKVSSDKDLNACFLDEGDYYNCPLPSVGPVFTDKGVEFIYNEYEIAAYALGRPRFTVPYADLEPYMMVTAKELL